jgi:hypothetical protein
MPDTLDDKLQEIVASGNFSHLSILSSASGGKVGFHASFSPAASWGNGHGFDQDPVQAALKAIENAPKSRKRASPDRRPTAPSPGKDLDDCGQVARRERDDTSTIMGLFEKDIDDDQT